MSEYDCPLGREETAGDLDARLADLHLDLLAATDELRAGQARISTALELVLVATALNCLVLAVLVFGMRGGL